MAWKMLDAGHYARAVQPVHRRPDHDRDLLRVTAESAAADYDVVGIGICIRHRCKVEVEAVLSQIFPDGRVHIAHSVLARGGLGLRPVISGHVKGRGTGDAGYGTALLVGRNERRKVGFVPQRRDERVELIWILNIFAEQGTRRLTFKILPEQDKAARRTERKLRRHIPAQR